MFVVFYGNDTSKNPTEQIRIIGETWNCVVSGSSIICLGFAQITDNSDTGSEPDYSYWEHIIGDKIGFFGVQNEKGLIYNVKCH
jgi:hypothetical protein